MTPHRTSSVRAAGSALALALCLLPLLAGCALGAQPRPPHATIYVTTQEESISAIDAATGAIRWTFRGGGMLVMTLSGDTLYAASSAGEVYALDSRTGQTRWQYKTSPQTFFTSCVVAGGALYTTANRYGSSGNTSNVFAFDASTGALRYQVAEPGYIIGELTTVANHLYLAMTANDTGAGPASVSALRASDGATLWRAATTAGVRWSLSADAAQVYISTLDGVVEALGASDGALHWRRVIGTAGKPLSTVAPDGATLYVGDGRGSVSALRASDGAQVWKRNFPNTSTSVDEIVYTPEIVSGALYLTSMYSSTVYALRPADGATLWSHDTLGYNTGQSPLVMQSAAYVIAGPYSIDILDAQSGSSLATYDFSSHHNLVGMESLAVGPPLPQS